MTFMITATGREHHVQRYALGQSEPNIEEIAHSLAQINRFGGHAKRPYSVAEHSLLVSSIAQHNKESASVQLAALMHDAHEAYTGDVATPIKWELGEAWAQFEFNQAHQVQKHFQMRSAMVSAKKRIKQYDLIALSTERRDLTQYDPERHTPWPILDHPAHIVLPLHESLDTEWRQEFSWDGWRDVFLDHYNDLAALAKIEATQPNASAHKSPLPNRPLPNCPNCGNNHQVWANQRTGVLTCHRAFCDTPIPDSGPPAHHPV